MRLNIPVGKLTATYHVSLPTKMYFLRSINEGVSYKTRVEEFDVELIFGTDEESSILMSPKEPDKRFVFGVSDIRVSVSRNEPISLPEDAPATADDGSEATVLVEYLKERENEYFKVANEVLNRATLFFKYRLRHSNLVLLDFHKTRLISGIKWTDADGKHILNTSQVYVTLPTGKYGFMPLTVEHDTKFLIALEKQIVPELHEEILFDALSAITQRNYRRAVLEMAIACEIIIKQAFFSKSTPAGEAFEFLEEDRKVEVSPKDLIHKVAERAFGESFQKTYPKDWNNIDLLFRCRNKVAHRGLAFYRDEKGQHEVNSEVIDQWWTSIQTLIKWLEKFTT